MFNDSTNACESIATLVDRDVRALTECMTVLEDTPPVRDADGLYEVVSQSGRTYTVDVYGKSCTCPDACHNDHVCKHQRRVMFACGMRPIPGGLNRDAIDRHLGEHVTTIPRVGQVVTDGGPALVDADHAEKDSTADRPNDCACTGPSDALVCWPCYREGFDAPNPNPDAAE